MEAKEEISANKRPIEGENGEEEDDKSDNNEEVIMRTEIAVAVADAA